MPKVPGYDNFEVLPGVRQPARVQNQLTPEAASLPGRQLQGMAGGLADAGAALGNYAQAEQEKVNKVRLNDAFNQAEAEAQRLTQEYSKLQGAAAVNGIKGQPLTAYYAAELDKSLSKIGSGLTAPVVKDQFALSASQLRSKFAGNATAWEVEQGRVYADQVRDATVVSAFNIITANPGDPDVVDFEIARAEDALRDKFTDAGYAGEALEQQIAGSLGKAHNAIIEGLLARDDLAGAKAYFEKYKEDYLPVDAQEVPAVFARADAEARRKRYESLSLGIVQDTISDEDLASAHANKEIDDGEYASLLGQAAQVAARKEAEQKARVNEWRDRNFASLQVGISDGTMTRADADRMYQRGEITPSQWSQASRMGADKSAANTAMGEFVDYLSSGLPIDPANTTMKKGADEYFKQLGGVELFKQDFPAAMAAVTTMARDGGIIPQTAVTVLRGMKASGTPDQQTFAIKAIADLYAVQPNAAQAAFTDTEIAEGLSLQFKMEAGIDPMQAYQGILKEREALADPKGVPAALKAEGRSTAVKMGDGFRNIIRIGGGMVGGGMAEQQAIQNYEQAYQNFFIQHGDRDLAKRQADATIARTFGVSVANGGKTMMHPPENYYPGAGDWLRDSLVDGVSELMGVPVAPENIELVSDALTTKSIIETGKPVYTVVVKTNGLVEPIGVWTYDEEAAADLKKKAKFANDWNKAKSGEAQSGAAQRAAEKRVKLLERQVAMAKPVEDSVAWANMSAEERRVAREAYKRAQQDLADAKKRAGL